MTGQTTVSRERVTVSGSRTALFRSNVSTTTEETERALLTADECLRMPGPVKDDDGAIVTPGDMLVYVAGSPAVYGKQPLYFKDEAFAARAAIPAPEVSEKTRAAPKRLAVTI